MPLPMAWFKPSRRLKNRQKKPNVQLEHFPFPTVASESHGLDKTLESEHLSAAEQHLDWRHFREPTL
jgi:hypothetical protein